MNTGQRDVVRGDRVRGDQARGDAIQPLAGQVAAITGAGRGIGAAIAKELSSLGAATVLCGRTRAALDSTGQTIAQAGGKAEVVLCDVTSMQSVEAAAGRVEGSFGRLDILVNNAGIGGFGGPLHQLLPDSWEQILNTNLRGVYYAVRAFAPMMIRARSGHIINISSLAGKNALPNGAAYAASKWGLNGLSYSLAEELRGIQHPRGRDLPGIYQHGTEPAHWQGPLEDAATGRRGTRRGDAGDTECAVVCERDSAEAYAETIGSRGRAALIRDGLTIAANRRGTSACGCSGERRH